MDVPETLRWGTGDGCHRVHRPLHRPLPALPEGTSDIIEAGDKIVDNIKNYEMGTVVSYETVPAVNQVLDSVSHKYVQAQVEGFEDILVTIESPCTESDQGFILGGGYELRVGVTTYIKGEGYMASGPVVSVEREGQA